MGKKNQRDQGSGIGDQKVEKQITGSGAEVVSHEDEQGMVKCKCIVPCVWRGYRDEGDTVWIEKELVEKDAFIRMHFNAVDGVVADAGQDGQGEGEGEGQGEGADRNDNSESDNADGGSGNADGADGNGEGADRNDNSESDNADGGSGNADGADGNGEGADGNGQGELDLK